jgi:hypothetical protein
MTMTRHTLRTTTLAACSLLLATVGLLGLLTPRAGAAGRATSAPTGHHKRSKTADGKELLVWWNGQGSVTFAGLNYDVHNLDADVAVGSAATAARLSTDCRVLYSDAEIAGDPLLIPSQRRMVPGPVRNLLAEATDELARAGAACAAPNSSPANVRLPLLGFGVRELAKLRVVADNGQ